MWLIKKLTEKEMKCQGMKSKIKRWEKEKRENWKPIKWFKKKKKKCRWKKAIKKRKKNNAIFILYYFV